MTSHSVHVAGAVAAVSVCSVSKSVVLKSFSLVPFDVHANVFNQPSKDDALN